MDTTEHAVTIPCPPRDPGLNINRPEDRIRLRDRLTGIVALNGADPVLCALTIIAEIDDLDTRPLWAIAEAAIGNCAPSA